MAGVLSTARLSSLVGAFCGHYVIGQPNSQTRCDMFGSLPGCSTYISKSFARKRGGSASYGSFSGDVFKVRPSAPVEDLLSCGVCCRSTNLSASGAGVSEIAAETSHSLQKGALRQAPETVEGRFRGKFLVDDVGPNALVLEAQARVCTGPKQTRPLEEEKMREVLQTIIRSARGELPVDERVSEAQLGAFFGAMTLRANAFPAETQWSAGERRAMEEFWPQLESVLPHDVLFIADPEGSIFGGLAPVGPYYVGRGGIAESRLVGALREVLEGGHLGFEETVNLLRHILPMGPGAKRGDKGGVGDALIAAYLICQRMNCETDRELKAYCMAFDEELAGKWPWVPQYSGRSEEAVGSVAEWEACDGRSGEWLYPQKLWPCSFLTSVAAARLLVSKSGIYEGTGHPPGKNGVTEEQMLIRLGAATNLSPASAARLLEDPEVGFAYVSLREGRPAMYTLQDMRLHIKKRPPLATTEKVQRFVQATGREAMVAGFYHEGYEEPLLMLIRRHAVAAGLVVKGEEGALSFMTRPRLAETSVKGRPVNYCAGFRPMVVPGEEEDDGFHREAFAHEVDATQYGFEATPTPRTDKSVTTSLELGLAALRGEKGPAYDRIIFNAAMHDHLLGCEGAADPQAAIARAREAVDSGRALKHLEAYIQRSLLMK
eukprot:jgi/Mesen1/6815/ME000035S06197